MVLIKNQERTLKDDKLFDEVGNISECLPRDTYKVTYKDGKMLVRHYYQLKVLPGDIVFNGKSLLNTVKCGACAQFNKCGACVKTKCGVR